MEDGIIQNISWKFSKSNFVPLAKLLNSCPRQVIEKLLRGRSTALLFVGGHQMQAGIGTEWVLRDGKRTAAKFRHDAREGVQIEAAAQEVVGDLMKYIGDH